jgi:hypothetical protein
VATRRIIGVGTRRLDEGQAGRQRRSGGDLVGEYDECCAQAMAKHAVRVVRKQPLNLDRGISAMCEQECKRVIASSLGSRIGLDGRGR